jgi:type I restriction enzyme S subunit
VRCICSHRYHILRARPDLAEAAYLSSFLRTSFGHLLLNEHSRGAAGRNRPLNINTLLKEKIPVPPLSEQGRLAELVALETQLAVAIRSTSDRLREYRDRLIADIVTGKLDVRAVAASLPDVADLEPIDAATEEENFDEEAMDEADAEDIAA